MGYNRSTIQAEIDGYFKKRNDFRQKGDHAAIISLSKHFFEKYPHDFRVMNQYMWDIAGDYADNDPTVLLDHYDEFSRICNEVLNQCNDAFLRFDAITMQGKLLYAQGRQAEAIALYQKELPDWYMTKGQKLEQLIPKNTPEFDQQLKENIYNLGILLFSKKCKELLFSHSLSSEEILHTAISLCQALFSLAENTLFSECYYFAWFFANDILQKLTNSNTEQQDLTELKHWCKICKEAYYKLSKQTRQMNVLEQK